MPGKGLSLLHGTHCFGGRSRQSSNWAEPSNPNTSPSATSAASSPWLLTNPLREGARESTRDAFSCLKGLPPPHQVPLNNQHHLHLHFRLTARLPHHPRAALGYSPARRRGESSDAQGDTCLQDHQAGQCHHKGDISNTRFLKNKRHPNEVVLSWEPAKTLPKSMLLREGSCPATLVHPQAQKGRCQLTKTPTPPCLPAGTSPSSISLAGARKVTEFSSGQSFLKESTREH